ncbi:MAG: hypothetical protein KJO43_14930, partial [Phycisphaerae bacterium]|nr:hypothetical protein [Phycisphaerae bacterium]
MSTRATARPPRRLLRRVWAGATVIAFVVLAGLWITVLYFEVIRDEDNVGMIFGIAPSGKTRLIAQVGPTGACNIGTYPNRPGQGRFVFKLAPLGSWGTPPPSAPPGQHLLSLLPSMRSLPMRRLFRWHLAPLLLITGVLAYHAAWRPLRHRRRRRGRCSACNYDLSGNGSGVCPECGQEAAGPMSSARRAGDTQARSE